MDVLAILFILMVGFLLGYGVRELISQQRHAAARRYGERLHGHLSNGGATPIPPTRDQSGPRLARAVIAARANNRASS
jgi:hypothetical protein